MKVIRRLCATVLVVAAFLATGFFIGFGWQLGMQTATDVQKMVDDVRVTHNTKAIEDYEARSRQIFEKYRSSL